MFDVLADDVYVGSMNIGSGSDTIKAHSWFRTENDLMISFTVTEGDCTPVTVSIVGTQEDGTYKESAVQRPRPKFTNNVLAHVS